MIDWVMRWEGVSFRHAVELLRDGIASASASAATSAAPRERRPAGGAVDGREVALAA